MKTSKYYIILKPTGFFLSVVYLSEINETIKSCLYQYFYKLKIKRKIVSTSKRWKVQLCSLMKLLNVKIFILSFIYFFQMELNLNKFLSRNNGILHS